MRIKAVLLSLAIISCSVQPAFALNRVQNLFGMNPQSIWMNMEQRDARIGIGTYWWQILCGSSQTCAGGYTDLTIVPVSGLTVAVGPSFGNTTGAVYQLQAEEVTAFGGYPSGVGTYLATDPTQVMLQGLAPTNTATMGPLNPPGTSGQSIDYLIECNVQTVDTTLVPISVVSALGTITSANAYRDRNDVVKCQSKTGTAATTGSQVAPTVDSGWVALGYVAVPYSTSTITTGMIHAYPPLSGYVLLSPSSAQTGTISVSGSITSGAGLSGTTGTFSGPITDVGETSSGNVTTYLAASPTTGSLFFGSSGVQYITYNGSAFQISAPVTAPSLTAGSLVSLVSNNLTIGAGSGADGVLVNYNTGGTAGMSVYNGGTGLGPFAASSGGFSGVVTTTGLTSSGPVSGTTGSFTGSVTGAAGSFSGSLTAGSGSSAGQIYDSNQAVIDYGLCNSASFSFESGACSGAYRDLYANNLHGLGVYAGPGNFTGAVAASTLAATATNATLTLGVSGTGGGFVNAAGPDILYLNFGTGTGGVQFCSGNNTCFANVNSAGLLTATGLNAPSGTITGATFVDTSGLLYLNAADTQYLSYSGGYMNFSSPLSTNGLIIQNINGTATLGAPNAGGGFVSANVGDPLYLNFGSGNGVEFCNGAGTCPANISGDGTATFGPALRFAGSTGPYFTTNGTSFVIVPSGMTGGGYISNATNTTPLLTWDNIGNFGAAGNLTGNVVSGNGINSNGAITANGLVSGGSASFTGSITSSTNVSSPTFTFSGGIPTLVSSIAPVYITGHNANAGLVLNNTLPTTGIAWFQANGTTVANVTNAGQFVPVSDKRLKHNIQPLTAGLQTVSALSPVSFNWNADNKRDIGLIAQDVKKVVPSAVRIVDTKRGYMGVNYTSLVPVLIKAVQEQQAQIKEQQTDIAHLEFRLGKLEHVR